ncbi:hypothetical protein HYX12_00185 [Candidatus Woesearchaeota archaeon]|nr:hypothetical protein [Candidatus Woesearchaeota archaeon]
MYKKGLCRDRNSSESTINFKFNNTHRKHNHNNHNNNNNNNNKLNLVQLNKQGQVTKKGQVTMFIILGMVLLLGVVLIVSLKKEVITINPEELIPTEKGKVEEYISTCMEKLGEEALFKLGLQGGYIEVPAEVSKDASQHLRISPFQVIPYWAYGQNNLAPSLSQIKFQIDHYIESNLRSCVMGLEPFKEVYDITEKSGITSNTEIVASRVIFNVRWELQVKDKAGELISELVDHVADSNVKLKKVYDTAKEIVDKEMGEMKLEDITQDLIALEHEDLPAAGMELSCKRKTWSVIKAKERLQDMLRINIQQLKVEGTEFVEFPDTLPYYQNHYIWNIGDDFLQSDVSVLFNYENNYPFTFQVTPTQGGKMVSGLMGGTDPERTSLLSNLCVQSWKFTYDVMYPVMVRVRDETTGYNFDIAFTVHLVRNMPNRKTELIARTEGALPYYINDEYCDQANNLMSIITWEKVDNWQGVSIIEPLDEVNISFSCLKYGCDVGETSFNYQTGGYQAMLSKNFPYCVGGILRGEKKGYLDSWERVVTEGGKTVELNLVPLFSFPLSKVKIVKHEFDDKSEGLKVSFGEELAEEELALLRMKAYKIIPTDTSLGTPASKEKFHEIQQVVGERVANLDEEAGQRSLGYEGMNIDFLGKADFTYEVELDLFDGEKLIGGYRGNWTVPWSQLENGQEITFHALTKGRASEAEQFEMIAGLSEYSKNLPLPEIR